MSESTPSQSTVLYSKARILHGLTNMREKPIMIMPMSEASQRPILCPSGPKRLVPISQIDLINRLN